MSASSTEPSVFGEDMALKPFSYYSFMDSTGIAERRLNGIRVDRNIPPFALLCASISTVSPIPRLGDFLGEHPRYELELRDISLLLGEHSDGINAPLDSGHTPTGVSPTEILPQPEEGGLRNIPGRTIYNTDRNPGDPYVRFVFQYQMPQPTDLINIPGRTIYTPGIIGANITPLLPFPPATLHPSSASILPPSSSTPLLASSSSNVSPGLSSSTNVPPGFLQKQTTGHGSQGSENSDDKENQTL